MSLVMPSQLHVALGDMKNFLASVYTRGRLFVKTRLYQVK